MDTKRLISMMLLSFAVILGYQLLINHFYGPPHQIGGNPTTQTATTTTAPTTQVATTQEQVSPPATQPTIATIGVDAAYPMVVKINSGGAGLDSVTLKEFKAPNRIDDYSFQ